MIDKEFKGGVMDIQKEREAFEAWLFKEYLGAKDFVIVYRPDENIYEHRPTQARWEAWQAAKAQAVPEGFVLVPKEPTEEMLDATINLPIPAVYMDSISGQRKLEATAYYKAMINKAQEQSQ